jgi:CBS domain-containing protein
MVALRHRGESGAICAVRDPQASARDPQTSGARAEGVVDLVTRVACAGRGDELARLRELLVDRGQHCVPIVGDDGRPVGVVTQSDLLRALGRDDHASAGAFMTPLVFALPITASIEQAAALMAYEGVDQIVVTGMNGQVAGVVRALDVARRCARSAGYLVDRQEER